VLLTSDKDDIFQDVAGGPEVCRSRKKTCSDVGFVRGGLAKLIGRREAPTHPIPLGSDETRRLGKRRKSIMRACMAGSPGGSSASAFLFYSEGKACDALEKERW